MGYKEDMARCRNYVAEHLREELTPAEPAERSAAFEISRQTAPTYPKGIPAHFIVSTSRLPIPAPATQDTPRRSRQKTS